MACGSNENRLISYEDILTSAKIPRRVYTLTEQKLRDWVTRYGEAMLNGATPVGELSQKTFLELLFFNHTINLILAYKTLLTELDPNSENAIWRLEFNIETQRILEVMKSTAKAISERKISVGNAQSNAEQVLSRFLSSSSANFNNAQPLGEGGKTGNEP